MSFAIHHIDLDIAIRRHAAIESIRGKYAPSADLVDDTDGVSIAVKGWRSNLRASNTEPVIRLNIESDVDMQVMRARTEEIPTHLRAHAE